MERMKVKMILQKMRNILGSWRAVSIHVDMTERQILNILKMRDVKKPLGEYFISMLKKLEK